MLLRRRPKKPDSDGGPDAKVPRMNVLVSQPARAILPAELWCNTLHHVPFNSVVATARTCRLFEAYYHKYPVTVKSVALKELPVRQGKTSKLDFIVHNGDGSGTYTEQYNRRNRRSMPVKVKSSKNSDSSTTVSMDVYCNDAQYYLEDTDGLFTLCPSSIMFFRTEELCVSMTVGANHILPPKGTVHPFPPECLVFCCTEQSFHELWAWLDFAPPTKILKIQFCESPSGSSVTVVDAKTPKPVLSVPKFQIDLRHYKGSLPRDILTHTVNSDDITILNHSCITTEIVEVLCYVIPEWHNGKRGPIRIAMSSPLAASGTVFEISDGLMEKLSTLFPRSRYSMHELAPTRNDDGTRMDKCLLIDERMPNRFLILTSEEGVNSPWSLVVRSFVDSESDDEPRHIRWILDTLERR